MNAWENRLRSGVPGIEFCEGEPDVELGKKSLGLGMEMVFVNFLTAFIFRLKVDGLPSSSELEESSEYLKLRFLRLLSALFPFVGIILTPLPSVARDWPISAPLLVLALVSKRD